MNPFYQNFLNLSRLFSFFGKMLSLYNSLYLTSFGVTVNISLDIITNIANRDWRFLAM